MDDTGAPSKPWYRQFWPWFLIAIPMTAVIAGVTTVIIAVRNADTLVVDDYYRAGLAINQELARSHEARARGLRAQLVLDFDARRLRVQIDPKADTARLALRLIHATDASRDHTVALKRDDPSTYQGALPMLGAGHWYVRLEPSDRAWRLAGRLQLPGDHTLTLGPG